MNPGPVFFVLGMEGKMLSIYGHAVVRGFERGKGEDCSDKPLTLHCHFLFLLDGGRA